jgi:hypothetical protein
MSKTVTLEIPQSELEKFNLELTRTVAILQEQQRESEEQWERLARLDDRFKQMMVEITKRLENVDRGFDRRFGHSDLPDRKMWDRKMAPRVNDWRGECQARVQLHRRKPLSVFGKARSQNRALR